MHVFVAKSIQGTAYLPGANDKEINEINKDNNN